MSAKAAKSENVVKCEHCFQLKSTNPCEKCKKWCRQCWKKPAIFGNKERVHCIDCRQLNEVYKH